MTYNIIGTGNTAWLFATKLYAAGYVCNGVYGRDINKATILANTIDTKPYLLKSGVPDNTDICILAISDNAITEVCSNLQFSDSTLIHTAGALSIDILSSAASKYGVLWPVYSITKDNLPDTKNIPIVFEASNPDVKQLLEEIGNSFTNNLYEADSQKRKWLHLTAVFSNNFTNHLFSIAEKICAEQDIPFSILLPIIQQTTYRLLNSSPFALQTGPAKRNDSKTQETHLDLLELNTHWQEVYRAISASIQEMYKK